MEFLTTDGKVADNGSHYHTADGSEVMLVDAMKLSTGEFKYRQTVVR
jgi:hypothetical protein